jgi:Rieske Fe-S protein
LQTRRTILVWAFVAAGSGLGLFSAALCKVIAYIVGPRLTDADKARLANQSRVALEQEMFLERLRAERLQQPKIRIASLSELTEEKGKLYTDYFLQPGIVFKIDEASCVARSAVCTHLGCTVQADLVDGKIYCPCHVSYFDVKTGQPLEGPARIALAEEPLVIEGDTVYLVKPTSPIKIGPGQIPMSVT